MKEQNTLFDKRPLHPLFFLGCFFIGLFMSWRLLSLAVLIASVTTTWLRALLYVALIPLSIGLLFFLVLSVCGSLGVWWHNWQRHKNGGMQTQ